MEEIQQLQNDIEHWSDETFGFNRLPTAPMHHLKKEIDELIESPYDTMEYADCFMLLLDSARMAGINCELLILATKHKLKVNRNRQWGEPDSNGVVEHI